MFEHKRRPLLTWGAFLRRQSCHVLISGAVVGAALGVGVLGYHTIAGLGWIDSIYMAANILTGMGPTSPMESDAGKLFGSVYALFSGVVFLTAASVLLAPAVHRMLHGLHLEPADRAR